jgi:hypothetical protein
MTLLPLALLAATFASAEGPAAGAAQPVTPDPLTAAVVGYPITMEKLASHAAASHELRQAAGKEPMLKADLRQQGPKNATIDEMGAQLDQRPRVKAILDRHGLSGRDFLLLPSVVQATANALFAEKSGHPPAADHVNAPCLAMFKADRRQVERLYKAIKDDLRALGVS